MTDETPRCNRCDEPDPLAGEWGICVACFRAECEEWAERITDDG